LNVALDIKSSLIGKNVEILPLVSVDDKYVDKEKASKYLHQGYNAIPSRYRDVLQEFSDDQTIPRR